MSEPSTPKPKKKRWFQFSIRTILIVTFCVAVICAIYKYQKEREEDRRLQGEFDYDYFYNTVFQLDSDHVIEYGAGDYRVGDLEENLETDDHFRFEGSAFTSKEWIAKLKKTIVNTIRGTGGSRIKFSNSAEDLARFFEENKEIEMSIKYLNPSRNPFLLKIEFEYYGADGTIWISVTSEKEPNMELMIYMLIKRDINFIDRYF